MANRYVLVFLATFLVGCQNHLLFVEGSHLGLKMKVQASQATPGEVDLGYRRGMAVVIPSNKAGEAGAKPTVKETGSEVVVQQNSGEVMSLYSRFQANVGWNDPVEVKHFLATGNAAVFLLARPNELGEMTASWNRESTEENP